MEPGQWAPRHPLVHRSGTVRAGALPTALHRAPCPPQSRYGWAALQPGREGKWSLAVFGGSEVSCWEWVSPQQPSHAVADHSGPWCAPKAVIRAASCAVHVPDFSAVLFVARSPLPLCSEAFLFIHALRLGAGFSPTPFHFLFHVLFSSLISVCNY